MIKKDRRLLYYICCLTGQCTYIYALVKYKMKGSEKIWEKIFFSAQQLSSVWIINILDPVLDQTLSSMLIPLRDRESTPAWQSIQHTIYRGRQTMATNWLSAHHAKKSEFPIVLCTQAQTMYTNKQTANLISLYTHMNTYLQSTHTRVK